MKSKKQIPVWAVKFKKHCRLNGLTAREVAIKTGLSEPTINAYFQGRIKPKDSTKELLANKIGINIYEVFINKNISQEDVNNFSRLIK